MATVTTNTNAATLTFVPSYEALRDFIHRDDRTNAIACLSAMTDNLELTQVINVLKNAYQCHPVFYIMRLGMVDMFKQLLNHPDFDFAVADSFGEPMLTHACYAYMARPHDELLEVINILLEHPNVDINQPNINKETIAHLAVQDVRFIGILEKLINNSSCDLNKVDDLLQTPLVVAIIRKNVDAIQMLGRRKDVIVRVDDVVLAKEYGINLNDIIGEFNIGTIDVSDKAIREAEAFKKALAEYKAKFN